MFQTVTLHAAGFDVFWQASCKAHVVDITADFGFGLFVSRRGRRGRNFPAQDFTGENSGKGDRRGS
jgi:hypothetical protein